MGWMISRGYEGVHVSTEPLFDKRRLALWAKETTIRVGKRFAQTASAAIVARGTGLIHLDWLGVLDVAGLTALLSFLASVAVYPKTDNE